MAEKVTNPNIGEICGVMERACIFFGIQTGSTEGNLQAFKALINKGVKEAASIHGWPQHGSIDSWYGKGRVAIVPKEEDHADDAGTKNGGECAGNEAAVPGVQPEKVAAGQAALDLF